MTQPPPELWLNLTGARGKCTVPFSVLRPIRKTRQESCTVGVNLSSLSLVDYMLLLQKMLQCSLGPMCRSQKEDGFSGGTWLGIRADVGLLIVYWAPKGQGMEYLLHAAL